MPSLWCLILTVFLTEALEHPNVLKTESRVTITDHDINTAVKFAQSTMSRMERLEKSLTGSKIDVEEDSPSHGQLVDSYPSDEAVDVGRQAAIANKATLYLIQKHCLKHKISTHECAKLSVTWTFSSSPLMDKCSSLYSSYNCSSSSKYRSYDGSCNHLSHPSWGQTFTSYRRILFPQYSDGVMNPRRSVTKRRLPSARYISNVMVYDVDIPEREITLALAQWTQFISNDLVHTPLNKMTHFRNAIECCRPDGGSLSPRYIHPSCQQIDIPLGDPDYSSHRTTCMNYVRSVTSLNENCYFGPANQMNQVSHFLDGSMLYGSTSSKALSLRSLRNGRLAMTTKEGKEFLTSVEDPEEKCQIEGSNAACYKSGDSRVNENPSQSAMYTIWAREHNRIARRLSTINSQWSDEKIYQEARKIVIAEIQHITYQHWLPLVLGQSYIEQKGLVLKKKGFSSDFTEDENPRVSNSFATSAIRFYISMFQSNLKLMNENRSIHETISFGDYFYNPYILERNGYLDMLLRALTTQTSQKMDSYFIEDVTSQLYKGPNGIGQDVVSLDIQRGRDHGLPSYTHFRKLCNLPVSNDFDTLTDTIPSDIIEKLKSVYAHPDDIDLFVGGIAERSADDSILGFTFRCLIGEQMLRTRKGDRYFYDLGGKPHSFTEDQVDELRKTSLARILCDNTDIAQLQADVFKIPSDSNPLVNCTSDEIPSLNLNLWKSAVVT